jgi:hypothetical protein
MTVKNRTTKEAGHENQRIDGRKKKGVGTVPVGMRAEMGTYPQMGKQ